MVSISNHMAEAGLQLWMLPTLLWLKSRVWCPEKRLSEELVDSSMTLKGFCYPATAAPKLTGATQQWLRVYGIPYTEVRLTGCSQVFLYLDPQNQGPERGRYLRISACRTFFMPMTLTVNRWHGDGPSCGLKRKWSHPSSTTSRPVLLGRPLHTCLPAHLTATSILFCHCLVWLISVSYMEVSRAETCCPFISLPLC